MGDDAAGEAHVQLAAASHHVGVHRLGVPEVADRDAVLFLIAEVDDALAKILEVRAALNVEGCKAVSRERLQKGWGAELLEQSAEGGGRSNSREAATARKLGFCDWV